jgi:hypothetical protein
MIIMGQVVTLIIRLHVSVAHAMQREKHPVLWFLFSCTLSVMHSDTASAGRGYSSGTPSALFTRFPLLHALHASSS